MIISLPSKQKASFQFTRNLFFLAFQIQVFQDKLHLLPWAKHLLVISQVHPLFDKAESKNKLLRSVAGGGVDQIGQLQARWDKFEMMMESHELMVKEQVSNMHAQRITLVNVILPFGTLPLVNY